MEELTLEHFYAQSLGLEAPWKVTNVVIAGDRKEVRIRVECTAGEAWADPETRERAVIKDWTERTWRHLDICEYQTIISARVPRVKLSDGSTVREAARLAKITEDQADGVMERAVAAACCAGRTSR